MPDNIVYISSRSSAVAEATRPVIGRQQGDDLLIRVLREDRAHQILGKLGKDHDRGNWCVKHYRPANRIQIGEANADRRGSAMHGFGPERLNLWRYQSKTIATRPSPERDGGDDIGPTATVKNKIRTSTNYFF